MIKYKKASPKIYFINLTLLATHEIDSAFWHEWHLFKSKG
jgi:hypothetical protein